MGSWNVADDGRRSILPHTKSLRSSLQTAIHLLYRCVHNYHMGSVHAQNVYGDKFLAILSHILSMKKMIHSTLCIIDDKKSFHGTLS